MGQRRKEAIKYVQDRMKREPYEEARNPLMGFADECEVDLPSIEIQDKELMTWDQIRKVSRDGITIGSHTHTHRVLGTMDLASQREELSVAKSILEQEIGKKVSSISYPVGNYEHFSEETQAIARECGYELGFSFNTGVNTGSRLTALDIKRVAAPATVELTSAMTLLPGIFARANQARGGRRRG